MGAASAVIGGLMCLCQRHVKRMLAFSTIAHTGVMLIGLALLNEGGLAGMLTYLLGHGLAKAALFMLAGILLAMLGGIDEIGLRGLGKPIWPAGVAMGVGGLMLAGLPVGTIDRAAALIDAAADARGQDWLLVPLTLAAALTGGAVLRATGRIFLGWGPTPGEEQRAPTEEEQEKANRPLWLMLLPAAALLLLSLGGGGIGTHFAAGAASEWLRHAATSGAVVADVAAPHPWMPWLSLALALAIAGFDLGRRRLAGLGRLASGAVAPRVRRRHGAAYRSDRRLRRLARRRAGCDRPGAYAVVSGTRGRRFGAAAG